MAKLSLVLGCLAVALIAGCLGSGPDRGGNGDGRSSTTAAACGASDMRDRSAAPPALAGTADSDTTEGSNRTLRWDVQVDVACQEATATATATVQQAEPPQDCPGLAWTASVSTGLSEQRIDLAAQGENLHGTTSFTPSRTDLADDGPGSFVVSLAVTFAARTALQDDACLDTAVQQLSLAATYRLDA